MSEEPQQKEACEMPRKNPLPSFLVLISGAQCREGYGRLYETSEEEDWSLLYVTKATDLAQGYYLLPAAKTREAEREGIILTNAVGDRMGYRVLGEPVATLEQAMKLYHLLVPPASGQGRSQPKRSEQTSNE